MNAQDIIDTVEQVAHEAIEKVEEFVEEFVEKFEHKEATPTEAPVEAVPAIDNSAPVVPAADQAAQ